MKNKNKIVKKKKTAAVKVVWATFTFVYFEGKKPELFT